MSANILAPFGTLILVGGFLVVGISTNTTDTYVHSSTSVFSENAEEEENEFDKNFDPEKVHINILDKKGRPAKGISLELCIPDTDECVRAVHVGDGVYQPVEDIFGGAQGDSLIEVRIPGQRGKKYVSSTDIIKLK